MTVSVHVTGTDGKTTTIACVGAALRTAGWHTLEVSTRGVQFNGRRLEVSPSDWHPTATEVALELRKLACLLPDSDKSAVLLEVTSYWLKIGVVDELPPSRVGVITSLGHDHLDIHGSLDRYHRLKAELLKRAESAVTGPGVWERLKTLAAAADIECDVVRVVRAPGPIAYTNAEIAACVAFMLGVAVEFNKPPLLAGRQEWFRRARSPDIIVDTAHTPEAVATALVDARRQQTTGKLIAVSGAGGGRDGSKRRLIGRMLARHSDICIVTDDAPRFEEPEMIRQAVVSGCQNALCIEGRAQAIDTALAVGQPNDVIALLGLGDQEIFDGTRIHTDIDYLRSLGFTNNAI